MTITALDAHRGILAIQEKTFGSLTFNQDESRWVIDAQPHVLMRVKRILPRVQQARSGTISVADNPGVVRELHWIVDRWPLSINETDRELFTTQLGCYRSNEAWTASILSGHQYTPGIRVPARSPRPYQTQASDLCRATGRLLVVDELGLGKSMTGILVLQEADALPALIVTLAGLMPEQFETELAKTFPQLNSHVLQKAQPYDFVSTLGFTPDVLICNYHKLAGWADVLAGEISTVIFDEIHELRRPGSQKYVAAAQIADGAKYCMGLTGTLVFNYADEAHSVIDVISPGALGSRAEFNREWCVDTGSMSGAKAVSNPEALGTHLREEGLMLRRTRKDVGRELPDLLTITHTIESDTNVIDNANSSAAELARLILDSTAPQQRRFLARGELETRMRQATGIAKAPYVAAFVDLLLESERNLILFGWHHAVYDIWKHTLAHHNPVLYTGHQSVPQKRAAKQQFLNGDSRILMMSLRSGAGLDGLQDHCHVAVFGELDWAPAVHKQNLGRLHRDGQTEPVLGYYLLSDSGADPIMADALQIKRHQSDGLMDPDGGDPFTAATNPHDHIRRLAESLLNTGGPHPAGQHAGTAQGNDW